MNHEAYLAYIKEHLTSKRYEHTLRVVETAKQLADLYQADKEKIIVAAILHDMCKCETDSFLKNKIIDYSIDQSLLSYHVELWHGPVAAHYIKDLFAIEDETIFSCIYYHTTARANMSLEEKIIFLADYMEPGRQFPGVEEVRTLAMHSLDEAAIQALKNTITFLLSKNATLHPDTVFAYNDLIAAKERI